MAKASRKKNKANKRENQVNKKDKSTENFKNIATVIISLLALIISFISFLRNNDILTPKFSLEVLKADKNNSEDLNRIFKIYNVGGQIVNPKISPLIYMELYCISLDGDKLPDREGIILVEISDYFSEDYSYNNAESAFIIQETKANELCEMMENVENSLEQSNVCINLFSIKYYFQISYYDYKGENESKILYPMNNYAAIYYKNNSRERYFKNNELIEGSNREEDIIVPMNLENEDFMVCEKKGVFDSSPNGKERKPYEYLSSYIVEYLKKYSEKLEVNKNNGLIQVTNAKIKEFIINDKELIVGLILQSEHKNKVVIVLSSILGLILIFLIVVYIKRKKIRK